jgi:hypothetical protein
MSLEERNGKLYYYRSVRHGDTVRRVYVGSGELARIAYEGDVAEREAEREAERAAEEHARREAELERERLEALAAPVDELSEAADILARAHLIAAGCHRHKGEWRRARNS